MANHPDGVPLGHYLEHAGTYFLRLFCRCGRVYEIGFPQAVERLGPDIRTLPMRRRLRCRCGHQGLSSHVAIDYGTKEWRQRRGPAPELSAPWPDDVEIVGRG